MTDDIIKLNKTDYIATIAFNTQQILEKVLKLILYSCNISYKQVRNAGHTIQLLISLVKKQGIYVPDTIENMSSMISGWEAATRYDAFVVMEYDVPIVLNAYSTVRAYAIRVIEG